MVLRKLRNRNRTEICRRNGMVTNEVERENGSVAGKFRGRNRELSRHWSEVIPGDLRKRNGKVSKRRRRREIIILIVGPLLWRHPKLWERCWERCRERCRERCWERCREKCWERCRARRDDGEGRKGAWSLGLQHSRDLNRPCSERLVERLDGVLATLIAGSQGMKELYVALAILVAHVAIGAQVAVKEQERKHAGELTFLGGEGAALWTNVDRPIRVLIRAEVTGRAHRLPLGPDELLTRLGVEGGPDLHIPRDLALQGSMLALAATQAPKAQVCREKRKKKPGMPCVEGM
jgi:hypothetical protein